MYRPVLLQVPKPYSDNPWVLQHIQREDAYQEGVSPDIWGPQVLAQYHGHERPAGTCPCGGQLWYRATTGGHKCPNCLAYANSSGVIIGIPEAVKDDAHA